jgi:formylglycine-generating enzyme
VGIRKYLVFAFFMMIFISSYADKKERIKKFIEEYKKGMICLKGGIFTMGDSYRESGSFTAYKIMSSEVLKGPNTAGHCDVMYTWFTKGPHKVKLSPFCMHEREVTFRDYDIYTKEKSLPRIYDVDILFEEFKKKNGIKKKNMASILRERSLKRKREADRPALIPSWKAANDFCAWLKKESGLPFDLPTEAQWEYVASDKGRNKGCNATADGTNNPRINLPYSPNSTYKVKSYPPNPLGFYDLGGNLSEFVKDQVKGNEKVGSRRRADGKEWPLEIDPQGDLEGSTYLRRGGSYLDDNVTYFDRSFYTYKKGERTTATGFRCVLNMKGKNLK